MVLAALTVMAMAGTPFPDDLTHVCTLEDGDVHCWDHFQIAELLDCSNPAPLDEDTEKPGLMRLVLEPNEPNLDFRYGSRFFEPDFNGFGFDAVVLVPMQGQLSFEGGFAAGVEACLTYVP